MKTLILFLLIVFLGTGLRAQAQNSPAAQKKQILSVSVMALSSSTKQGGDGPSGSTFLSQSEYVYGWPSVGVGMFFLYDMQGSAEKDSAYGPKVEAYWDPFFLEVGYAYTVKRAYTDRTIAEQTGSGIFYGVGARFKIGAAAGPGGGWFFQASYKLRTYDLKKQDGRDLDEPIQQSDGYPLLGLGFQF